MTQERNSNYTGEEELYRCKFCGIESPSEQWIDNCCPRCLKEYDYTLAQDTEE